ncbi:hypothetical protein [uncultured Polaribacter sp.]|uniref:hypothetical protein n=1 Tax=uncultured Polaribacter sp. TaxID=174711 RepID=UPI0026138596|nr:hypothetical protein [uncultured Polaribacter sp.]
MSEKKLVESEVEAASVEEMKSWKEYLEKEQPKSIDVPFLFTLAAVTIGGIAHIKNPIEETWVEGTAIGIINGSFKLKTDRQRAKLYDPTGNLLRLIVELKIASGYFRARIDTRKWDGSWNKGSWVYIRF